MNYISLNYPNSDEGKEAENIYKNVLPKLANKDFIGDEESDKWKLVYQFPVTEREAATSLQKKLDEGIKEYNYFNMSTSIDYYNPDTIFVIVHGLNTRMGGRGFADVLKENKKYKIKKPSFEISSPNYKTIQIHKNLDSYLEQGTPYAEK